VDIAWGDLGLVLVVGLAVGAGVVALFALGVAAATGGGPDGAVAPGRIARSLSWLCFGACALVVVYGIYLAIPSLHKLF
jgi:hypothetical protein